MTIVDVLFYTLKDKEIKMEIKWINCRKSKGNGTKRYTYKRRSEKRNEANTLNNNWEETQFLYAYTYCYTYICILTHWHNRQHLTASWHATLRLATTPAHKAQFLYTQSYAKTIDIVSLWDAMTRQTVREYTTSAPTFVKYLWKLKKNKQVEQVKN